MSVLLAFTPTGACAEPLPRACFENAADYTYMWWTDGWRDPSRVFNIQTSRYGMSFDYDDLRLIRLGVFNHPQGETEALYSGNYPIENLVPSSLSIDVRTATGTFHATSAGPNPENCQVIESGKYFQRRALTQLHFTPEVPHLSCWLEIAAWPDRLMFLFHATPDVAMSTATLDISLYDSDRFEVIRLGSLGTLSALEYAEEKITGWAAGTERTVGVALLVVDTDWKSATVEDSLRISARQVKPSDHELDVSWERNHGHYRIALRNDPLTEEGATRLTENPENDRMGSIQLSLTNPTSKTQAARLCFAKDGAVYGITGISALIRDASGFPTGIPVQISKNWHHKEGESSIFQGPWYHAFTMMSVPPMTTLHLEYTSVNAHWGGVPAASHAQLCLIGWGTNQLWDQAALGSWGESITFDPDVNLQRSMIDDVRPLMVWGMQSEEPRKWTWTNNVGGGDFLVYFDEEGKNQWNSRMKTCYHRTGPNVTEVTYAGRSGDSKIDLACTASLVRSDDYVRILYHLRYDVRAPTAFSRLAFFQLGADRYNDHTFDWIGYGNLSGLIKEWAPEKGGKRLNHPIIECTGELPWFSLHQSVSRDTSKSGAWANRGLIIRSWKARLGGSEVTSPLVAIRGTDNGPFPSNSVELVPPEGLSRLEPGDFLEADLEQLTLPQFARDYYGPNAGLRTALAEGENTYKPVLREALGTRLQVEVQKGTLKSEYPLRIRTENGQAMFGITGGIGYVPVTLSGLASYRDPLLEEHVDDQWRAVDQSVHGNDFWQADFNSNEDSWEITYNLPLDSAGDKPAKRDFRFRL